LDGDSGCTESEAHARGWFEGAAECARVLADLTSLEVIAGSGFGGWWPVLFSSGKTIAPALPIVAEGETGAGPDGEYRVDGGSVWREAAGSECLYLTSERTQTPPGQRFDLLWFGDGERYLVRNGWLEIEDLFGLVRAPATIAALDRVLIRPQRVDSGVISALPTTDARGPHLVEVRRPEALSGDDRWREAERFLSARADVVSSESTRDTIEVRLHDGTKTAFVCDNHRDGWSLKSKDGKYVFDEICLERRASTLVVRATLADAFDVMAAGMRGRLIFDLRANLVALG
jgi:hypothetical protein